MHLIVKVPYFENPIAIHYSFNSIEFQLIHWSE